MSDPTSVDAVDSAKKTSEILGPSSDEATVQMSEIEEKCYWNDVEFTLGDRITTGDKCYECSFGRWVEQD